MTDGINPSMNPMQPSGSHASANCLFRETETAQLLSETTPCCRAAISASTASGLATFLPSTGRKVANPSKSSPLECQTCRMLRVLIADDHGIVRSGLRLLLERQPDIEVIAEASDGAEARDPACASSPTWRSST